MKHRLLAPVAVIGSLLLVSCARVGPMTIQLAPNQATSGENLAARDAAVAPDLPDVRLDVAVRGTLPVFDERILAWSISTRRGLGEELGKLAVCHEVDVVPSNDDTGRDLVALRVIGRRHLRDRPDLVDDDASVRDQVAVVIQ